MLEIAYLDTDITAKAFEKFDKNRRIIVYCQTGTRSTLTYLQLRLLGFKNPTNWDDLWRVYGAQVAYADASGTTSPRSTSACRRRKKDLRTGSGAEERGEITTARRAAVAWRALSIMLPAVSAGAMGRPASRHARAVETLQVLKR